MKKSLLITAALLGLSAANAYAHEVPAPTGGTPYTLIEPTLTWLNGVGTSTGAVEVNATAAAYHFDVTTAGNLDVFTNAHESIDGNTDLYIFKKDAVGEDWTLAFYNKDGDRISPTNPVNLFGVNITDFVVGGAPGNGNSDAGVRRNFDIGSYVAMVTTLEAFPLNAQAGTVGDGVGVAKLSEGFTWESDFFGGLSLSHDMTIMASPGSLAVVGPSVEEPAPVPVPAAIWLMGSALAGLGVVSRKKAQTLAA